MLQSPGSTWLRYTPLAFWAGYGLTAPPWSARTRESCSGVRTVCHAAKWAVAIGIAQWDPFIAAMQGGSRREHRGRPRRR